MNNKKTFQWAFVFMLSALLLYGCGPGQSNYSLKCIIDAQEYGFEITNESGTVQSTFNNESTSFDYDDDGFRTGITVHVNRDLLYTNSGHNYHIEGTITVNQITNEVAYDITATGDAFGGSPQTCKMP